ncbi:MAG: GPW/gp25 family protein [Nitrososphaeria archaeon]|nr:GPW/gp25 family protein [Nitrososphaeria archaeon]
MSLKSDLKLKFDEAGADLQVKDGDLQLAQEEENLAQAIVHRLMTDLGELEELGHPDYGSKLYDLIGQPNTEETRNLARTYVLNALSGEPRIKEIVSVTVSPNILDPNRIDIEIVVIPVGKRRPLTVFYSMLLEVV